MVAYRNEHRHPARIMVQKTSPFDQYEREGIMLRAADELGLDSCELVWVTNPTTRLYRAGYHPPRRGTCLELAPDHGVLYTREASSGTRSTPGCPDLGRSRFARLTSNGICVMSPRRCWRCPR
jgi:hypothetical protein